MIVLLVLMGIFFNQTHFNVKMSAILDIIVKILTILANSVIIPV